MPKEIGATRTRRIPQRGAIVGAVRNRGLGEALPPLGAFVAPSAMAGRDRSDAGEGVLEREVAAKLEDLCLRQVCERRPHLEWAVESELHE